MKRPPTASVTHHVAELHEHFLTFLPRVEVHGRIYFRHLHEHDRADAIQEMRALAWKWFLALHQRGKDPTAFIKSFTTLLARAVNSGRRLVGKTESKNTLNPATQRRHGFKVESLFHPSHDTHEQQHATYQGGRLHHTFDERLRDNTITPIPDQVQFRIDWPAWLQTLTPRERRLIAAMAQGERTSDLGREFELSPPRISQLRRTFRDGWRCFCDEQDEAISALR